MNTVLNLIRKYACFFPFFVFLFATSPMCAEKKVTLTAVGLPTLDMIQLLEMKIVMPRDASDISKYNRYYSWGSNLETKVIMGTFILEDKPGVIHILPLNLMPLAPMDGGCSVVFVKFDIKTGSFLDVRCNGFG